MSTDSCVNVTPIERLQEADEAGSSVSCTLVGERTPRREGSHHLVEDTAMDGRLRDLGGALRKKPQAAMQRRPTSV